MRNVRTGLLLACLSTAGAWSSGCTTGRAEARPTPPPSTALAGLRIQVGFPADRRRNNDAGCGRSETDFASATSRSLATALVEVGATPSHAREPWELRVDLLRAGMGVEQGNLPAMVASNTPSTEGPMPLPPGEVRNGSWGVATVSLDAVLLHHGKRVWQGSSTGHVDSVPCLGVHGKLVEALDLAVAKLRSFVIPEIQRGEATR